MRVDVIHPLPGEMRISTEVYAGELTASLRAVGPPSLEVTEVRSPEPFRGLTRRLPRLARAGGYADRYLLYQLRTVGRSGDVHHVVDHGYGHLAASLGPSRTVVTFHDALLLKLQAGEIPGVSGHHRTILGHRISLAAIRRAARVITASEAARRDFLRFVPFPPERVHVVPHGVSPRFLRPDGGSDRTPSPLAADAPLSILHVGHCGPTKNIETIVRALPHVRAQLEHPVRLVKVGSPFTAAQAALITRLRLDDVVVHLGRVAADRLPGVYASCDVVLLPSLYEGFGLPAIEAMAAGTPVVASRGGALAEVIGDAGLLVDAEDVDGVATAVARVLADPALTAELRRRGAERAREYTWERTARMTLDVYAAVHAEPGGRRR